MGKLARLNRQYDRMPEPWRFLTFFALVLLPITVIQLFSPVAYVLAALLLIGMRVWWLNIGSRP
jgi:hypothetical protein